MKTVSLGTSGLQVPAIAVGCMRMHALPKAQASAFVEEAMDLGANFFDHADCYGNGASETLFAGAVGMNNTRREKMLLQSKCGIVPGRMYDLSRDYIIEAAEGSLRRLKTDYLDVLMLHRPDALVQPEEVAEAFDRLSATGKVRYFGVSNHNPAQIQLLQKYLRHPLVANQLQFSIPHAGMVTQGLHVNMADEGAVDRDGGVLDFCRLHDITIQPWSPFQYGTFEGVFLGNPQFPQLNSKLDELAQRYETTATTIAMAWLLRHPANMQPVAGTTNAARLRECVRAGDILLSREEWYAIYLAAGNTLP